MTRRAFVVACSAAAAAAQQPTAKSQFGIAKDSYRFNPVKDTIEFLERGHGLGAAGVQSPLTSMDAAYAERLKRRAAELNMYVELTTGLPKADTQTFTRVLEVAQSLGPVPVRVACLSGRRYEDFSTMAEWQTFVGNAKAGIARALPIAEKLKVPLAVENHKDWTVDEMVTMLRGYSSDYLGVCLDFGNNVSLLDDPLDVVQKLAPFASSTHIKDMGVAEYPDGFLLSEVPMGRGFLDLHRMMEIVHGARPKARFNIEMITRNPLKVPCLTDKYWVTFPDRQGTYLARTMRTVRQHSSDLPTVDKLDHDAQIRVEDDNLKHCLTFA